MGTTHYSDRELNAKPDSLYINCTVITGDPLRPRTDALLLAGSRIVAVGDQAVAEATKSRVRRVDLAGSTVIPGFDDCHMHILSFGLTLDQIDLTPAAAGSIPAIRSVIESAAQSTPVEEWLVGRGYNQNLLPENRHPNRFDLDPVGGNHPIALWHTSGHILTANSVALALAGISHNTPDPPGGQLDRDEHGMPTGVLRETAMELLGSAIPDPSRETATEAILRASAALASEGITSAGDAATGHGKSADFELQTYREALESGRLMTRVVLMPQIGYVVPSTGTVRTPGEFDTGNRPEWLRIGPTKIFSDGALTTRTAAVTTPYSNSTDTGILTWEPAELEYLVCSAHAAGWQIATHAIGDRAIRIALDAYKAALERHPRKNARHRIEHATLIRREDVAAVRELGIVPVLQPEDIACLGDAYAPAVGAERAEDNSPVGWFKNAGIQVAFSSDRPVTPGHPLDGVRAAMERRTPNGASLGPGHRVDAERAIHYYSYGSAFASFSEGVRGRLLPGQLADFVVLDRDITGLPPEGVSGTRVLMTVVDGQAVYES